MTPTFLQKRRINRHALRSGMTIGVLVLLLALLVAYSMALSFTIASRELTQADKLSLITVLLITLLLPMGLINRIIR